MKQGLKPKLDERQKRPEGEEEGRETRGTNKLHKNKDPRVRRPERFLLLLGPAHDIRTIRPPGESIVPRAEDVNAGRKTPEGEKVKERRRHAHSQEAPRVAMLIEHSSQTEYRVHGRPWQGK